MYSVIIVPPACALPDGQIRIGSGERLTFGRQEAPDSLTITHEGVPRVAGEIAAQGTFWLLSNHSENQTYVVENPEGAGEHIKVAPGRVDAPVPFEFSRVVLPAAGDLLTFDVWAPRHVVRSVARRGLPGTLTAPAFTLDRTKRYFAVLAALCEPRLRGEPHAPLPAVEQLVERLRPAWPTVSRSAVYWNIDYLALKLRLRPGPETAEPGRRVNGKKETLVSLALRFDLVHEDDLVVLAPAGSELCR
ncbi:FHA domain-containing protein [Streptomyces justiciae]|uniref:FHA domain-containing protein n=1 Tax=Streptomyces justiciae TaxID=2780140 RepID=A0ABU3LNC2_9ACTN|nr:FHA domain-containing protein [Streptomyces justiciae]MBE8474360.1 FHA domain-containing protein [Streptomyces justiciae]MCW8384335.1 FHA domain-containing protein [Streptomyces justiciae]MDT7840734.1 FHA domain-containing protein [Streptomyces justiciae]